MLVENGNYGATVREVVVGENKKTGNLVVCFNFLLSDQANEILIKGYSTIAKADGTINTKAIDNLKEVFGWDGHNPFWLVDTDLSGIPVELVIENETMEDGKTYSRVKWINRPGSGGGQMPEMGDRNKILTKYGAKFRALSGGTPVKPSSFAKASEDGAEVRGQKAEVRAVAGPAPVPAVTLPLPGMTADGGQRTEVRGQKSEGKSARMSTMEKCWQVLCEANQGAERTALEKLWFDTIAGLFPGKDQADFGPEDWGKLEAKLGDDVAM